MSVKIDDIAREKLPNISPAQWDVTDEIPAVSSRCFDWRHRLSLISMRFIWSASRLKFQF
eukprot:snap_masked-scaffold_7-processed-gene-17.9-mRNA-1 protein AED:1.00 eAED:1.00 QI:0/-1/0/0/-1/1/1/0/59